MTEPFAREVAPADLEPAIRERLEELRRRADLVAIGLEDAVDALTAVFDRHKPGYPDGPEYEEHDEPVFDRAGAPQGHVRVKGDPIPGYYCETCREFSPCETVKDIAKELGVEVSQP